MKLIKICLPLLLLAVFSCSEIPSYRSMVDKHVALKELKLKNGLEVVLIQDKRFTSAAASISNAYGSVYDPEDKEGITHFIEHMLFISNGKYKEPDYFSKFVNNSGGSMNATTGPFQVNYYFTVAPVLDNFSKANDIFSQFFISPSFDPSFVEKEKNAIESEDQKNRIPRNQYYASKQLYSKNSPLSKYLGGNLSTLKSVSAEDAKDYFEKHYSANTLKLVLASPFSFKEMEKIVSNFYSDIPNRNIELPKYDFPLYDDGTLPALLQIKSKDSFKTLKLSFTIPNKKSYETTYTSTFINNLFNNRSDSSLVGKLFKDEYIVNSSAYAELENYPTSSFEIVYLLSEKGLANYNYIIEQTFKYINFLKENGLPDYIYKDTNFLETLALKYNENPSPLYLAQDASNSLLNKSFADYIESDKVFAKQGIIYSQEDFKGFLSELRPNKVAITLASDTVVPEITKNFYGNEIAYSIKNFDVSSLNAKFEKDEFSFPKKSPFPSDIPSVLTTKIDTQILSPESGNFMVKSDDTFDIPKTFLNLRLYRKDAFKDIKNKAAISIYTDIVTLNTQKHFPSDLGVSYSVSDKGDSAMLISLSGWSNRVPAFMQAFAQELKTPDYSMFEFVKKETLRLLDAEIKDPKTAYQTALENVDYFSDKNDHFKPEDLRDAIANLTLEDFKNFVENYLYSSFAMGGLAYGNVEEKNIKDLLTSVKDILGFKELPLDPEYQFAYRKFDMGKEYYLVDSSRDKTNAAYVERIYLDPNVSNLANLSVTQALIAGSFFEKLRTEKQIGYIVQMNSSLSCLYSDMSFLIQSELEPSRIKGEVDTWKKMEIEGLNKLTQEEFDKAKTSLIAINEKGPGKTIEGYYYVLDNNVSVCKNNDKFISYQVADKLKTLTLDEFKKFFKDAIELKNSFAIVSFALKEGEKAENYSQDELFGRANIIEAAQKYNTVFKWLN